MSLTFRTPTPSSRASLNIRLSTFDACWAVIAPFLALSFRDAYILSYDGALTTGLYFLASATFSVIAFLIFRLRDQMAQYFSVNDAIDVAKAVVFAEFMIVVVMFTFTRLEGIPRSTPIIHALILAAGLVAARTLVRLFHNDARVMNGKARNASEHIIMIGATRLSSLYIKMLVTYFRGQHQVIGVLDTNPQMLGRTIAGIRVIGTPDDLQQVIDEFAVHGIPTSRIIIGGDHGDLPEFILEKIKRVCDGGKIRLDFVSELIGLDDLSRPAPEIAPDHNEDLAPGVVVPSYFRLRRYFDFVAAMAMIVVFLPLLILVAILALLDVGYPVLFWQQRIGQGGQKFLIYKIRTLRAPYDRRGRLVPELQRLSWVGILLRRTRLDELPQLLNVLVGDMSLIGPRPLLPEDQPLKSNVRLAVRPGITGWAQVNGGTVLTPKEKGVLDEWYVRNASLWLDLRIIAMTIRFLLVGRGLQSADTLPVIHAAQTRRANNLQSRIEGGVRSTPRYPIFSKDRGATLAHRK
jgi:lipopolysaccharide/colanic/teichoic acid biosynthesis glycosyltransferase